MSKFSLAVLLLLSALNMTRICVRVSLWAKIVRDYNWPEGAFFYGKAHESEVSASVCSTQERKAFHDQRLGDARQDPIMV